VSKWVIVAEDNSHIYKALHRVDSKKYNNMIPEHILKYQVKLWCRIAGAPICHLKKYKFKKKLKKNGKQVKDLDIMGEYFCALPSVSGIKIKYNKDGKFTKSKAIFRARHPEIRIYHNKNDSQLMNTLRHEFAHHLYKYKKNIEPHTVLENILSYIKLRPLGYKYWSVVEENRVRKLARKNVSQIIEWYKS
jgi:predicted SprT family Zn-dependent metalloprotease